MRVTKKHLEAKLLRIVQVTKKPFLLSWEYGGVSLHIKLESGGESDVFNCGHVSKSEMAIRLDSFLEGIFNN